MPGLPLRCLAIGLACLTLALRTWAQDASPPLAADLQEQIQQIDVSVKNPYGFTVGGRIVVTTFRPAGDGPFPLVVMNHGRAIAERRAAQGRQRYEALSRYLVDKGFAVFVPTRLGYGDTYGQADPEGGGSCQALRPESMSNAAAEQVLATLEFARRQPWVDASRWVVIGQSVGSLAALGTAWRNPPGLAAVINFSGGTGGSPERRPGNPCSPQALESLWASKAAQIQLPMLWLYWRNDLYWGPEWPARWARSWIEAGGRVQFHHLPAVGKDGHSGLSTDMNTWVPIVEEFLARAGFTRPGMIARPAPSGHATIDDMDKVPAGRTGRELYRSKFLPAAGPRAFAVGPEGATGWAIGDWAMGRALGYCQASRGARCRLYAVDDEVVWSAQ